jgi:polar amino acid transport system substrate-binding protein
MKKVISMILAASMLCMCFVGCGDKVDESGTVTEVSKTDTTARASVDISDVKLVRDGTLTVGMEIGYPPFEYKAEDGSPIGYDVDLTYAVADKLGLQVDLVDTAFDVIFASLDTNYDCVISAVTITDKRKNEMLFSTPYIQNYQSVVVKKGSNISVSSLNDLSGHSVSLQKGTTSEELLNDLKATGTVTDCTVVTNEQILTAFTQLDNAEVDIVLCDSTVADRYIASSPDKYEILFKDTENPEEFGISFSLENAALQTAVNDALAQLKEEGFFEENDAKWFM